MYMNIKYKKNEGFTLIELLVVVAIISLLSSVVLASLDQARKKSRDSAIKEQVVQLRSLIELDRSESINYGNLEAGWNSADCTNPWQQGPLLGNYKDKAIEICKSIQKLAGQSSMTSSYFVLHTGDSGGDTNNNYSIMAWLPGKQRFLCIGSSGKTSSEDSGSWLNAGCYYNP